MLRNSIFELIPAGWQNQISPFIQKNYLIQINQNFEISNKKSIVFPKKDEIFNSLIQTSFEEVKVVIIGQDPYHNLNQAHGLAFSVPDGIVFPPSLKNIFKEIQIEYNLIHGPTSGNLIPWTKQGVLLMNTIWTVEKNRPNSHKDFGWMVFTQSIIQALNQNKSNLVFLLWGNHAKKFEKWIDKDKHNILSAAHPSPLSANKGGWFNSNIFKNTNKILEEIGEKPIQWL
ncbi:MAG: Uracil-DNA glycosylase, partial [Bacteroidota bacterium]